MYFGVDVCGFDLGGAGMSIGLPTLDASEVAQDGVPDAGCAILFSIDLIIGLSLLFFRLVRLRFRRSMISLARFTFLLQSLLLPLPFLATLLFETSRSPKGRCGAGRGWKPPSKAGGIIEGGHH